jgi:hypothetical protein
MGLEELRTETWRMRAAMKKNIAIMFAAALMLSTAGSAASAGQWSPNAYVYCGTPAGRGPTLIRPAAVVGRSCYLWFGRYGRVYGVWFLE